MFDTPERPVVEVLSTDPAADLVRKLRKYAAVGLPRYWVVDPEEPELVVFELRDGRFMEAARWGRDDDVEADFGPGVARFRLGDVVG